MQATVGEYWDSWFSSISCSSQSSLPTPKKKKKLGKKQKNTLENTEKKDQTRNQKKFPPPFSRPPPPRRLDQNCARFMSSSWNCGKVQPECTRERRRCTAKERGDCGAYLYHGGDRCERGQGRIGIIKPTGNGHVEVTRRPMYVKTLIAIHSIIQSQKVKTIFFIFYY
jgi:hypothetical protein